MQSLINNQLLDFKGQIYTKYDSNTQLMAIIALHSLKRGPALGGCRWLSYLSFEAGVLNAIELAKAMSYKAALSDVPYGGGKAVIIKPQKTSTIDREAYFASFGELVNSLKGHYITTIDSGLGEAELDLIAAHSPFVIGQSRAQGGSGNPSPSTAAGTLFGIKAAVKFKLKRDHLEGLHVAIQGVGSVGYYLAKILHAHGVKLTISDLHPASVQRCVDEFGASAVSPDKIFSVACDIFAPCALGATLNAYTIPRLKASIVAGCANNQLANSEAGLLLNKNHILYAPDYVINAGGLMEVVAKSNQLPSSELDKQIASIYQKTWDIFLQAEQKQQPTNVVADQMAEALLN